MMKDQDLVEEVKHNYKMVMNVILQQKMEKIFSMQKIQKKIK